MMGRKIRLVFLLMALMGPSLAWAQEEMETVTVHIFVRDECKHCHAATEFLDKVQAEKPEVKVEYYNLKESENEELFGQVTDKYELQKGTPITMIRQTLMVGFDSAETTGKLWLDLIENGSGDEVGFVDVLDGRARVMSSMAAGACDELLACDDKESSLVVTVPIIGKTIDTGGFSLFSLSAVLGLIDGFNPCAMWVLVMFLLLLSQVGSRKRMWQYAGLFILAQAIMYYLILTVWLAVWNFVALDKYVTPLIGLLALGSGAFFIYKWRTYKPVCDVASLKQQNKIEKKVAGLISKPLTLVVAIGIVGLALSVNIFEFVCSIGIPQAYTKILDINNLTWWGKQTYVFTYMGAYIFDDLIVFGLALYSFDKIGLTHKYSKWTTLIGGLLMLLLGVLMLFKPEWLVF